MMELNFETSHAVCYTVWHIFYGHLNESQEHGWGAFYLFLHWKVIIYINYWI